MRRVISTVIGFSAGIAWMTVCVMFIYGSFGDLYGLVGSWADLIITAVPPLASIGVAKVRPSTRPFALAFITTTLGTQAVLWAAPIGIG